MFFSVVASVFKKASLFVTASVDQVNSSSDCVVDSNVVHVCVCV